MNTEAPSKKELFQELIRNTPSIGETIYAPRWAPEYVNVCKTHEGSISVNAEKRAHVNTMLSPEGPLKAWVNAKILPYKGGFKWFLSGEFDQGLRCYLATEAIQALLDRDRRLDLMSVSRVQVLDEVQREGSKYLIVGLVTREAPEKNNEH